MSMGSKQDILTQEANRRIRNCTPSLPWSSKLPFINKLMVQMKWAGYSENSRQIVVTRTLAKMNKDVQNFIQIGCPIYRSKEERSLAPKKTKANWFRQSGATTTLSVPTTSNSGLAKLLRSKLKGTGPVGTSLKVLEMPGPTVIQSLIRKNLLPRETCGRPACPISNCKDNSNKESVLYQAVCIRCEETNPKVPPIYIGETSRTAYIRANQHREDCEKVIRKDPSQLFQEPLERMKDCSSWM